MWVWQMIYLCVVSDFVDVVSDCVGVVSNHVGAVSDHVGVVSNYVGVVSVLTLYIHTCSRPLREAILKSSWTT